MSLTDPIADLLTNIRNALLIKKETLEIPASNLSKHILDLFKKEGYIENLQFIESGSQGKIKIYLKYEKKKPAITGLKKISRTGLRKYVNSKEIPKVLNGLGIAVISTSKGILTDKEARRQKIGGEVLCYIW